MIVDRSEQLKKIFSGYDGDFWRDPEMCKKLCAVWGPGHNDSGVYVPQFCEDYFTDQDIGGRINYHKTTESLYLISCHCKRHNGASGRYPSWQNTVAYSTLAEARVAGLNQIVHYLSEDRCDHPDDKVGLNYIKRQLAEKSQNQLTLF